MWWIALIPLYLLVALAVARFCHLNHRLDEASLDYFSVLEVERRAERALSRARLETGRVSHERGDVEAPEPEQVAAAR